MQMVPAPPRLHIGSQEGLVVVWRGVQDSRGSVPSCWRNITISNNVGSVKHFRAHCGVHSEKSAISLSLKASLSNQRLARNRCGQELSPTQPSLSLSLFDSPLVVQNDHGV